MDPAGRARPTRPSRPSRRAFLRSLGLGAFATGVTQAAGSGPAAGAARAPWVSLTDARPEWHGDLPPVLGDGIADDAPAIQRVFDALGRPDHGVSGAYLLVPPGEYRLGSTVRVDRFAGVVQGAGTGHTPRYHDPGLGSALRWDGPADRPMVEVHDSSKLTFRELRFLGNDDKVPSAGLNFHKEEGDGAGSNGELSVEDCHFGTWSWTDYGVPPGYPSTEARRGLVAAGIVFDGFNGDNDQFRISRCLFQGRPGAVPTWGIRIANTQSVWGSIRDCTFSNVGVGIETSSSTMLSNAQFNRCQTDLDIRSTAQVDLYGWNSEHSQRLASLAKNAGLRSIGGYCQIDTDLMHGALVAAHPSNAQALSLQGMRFTWPQGDPGTGNRPAIEFGPQAGVAPAAGAGFSIRVVDCTGLHADQCRLVGDLQPETRGLVEWQSRHGEGIDDFRNQLRGSPARGVRQQLATDAWDVPGARP